MTTVGPLGVSLCATIDHLIGQSSNGCTCCLIHLRDFRERERFLVRISADTRLIFHSLIPSSRPNDVQYIFYSFLRACIILLVFSSQRYTCWCGADSANWKRYGVLQNAGSMWLTGLSYDYTDVTNTSETPGIFTSPRCPSRIP